MTPQSINMPPAEPVPSGAAPTTQIEPIWFEASSMVSFSQQLSNQHPALITYGAGNQIKTMRVLAKGAQLLLTKHLFPGPGYNAKLRHEFDILVGKKNAASLKHTCEHRVRSLPNLGPDQPVDSFPLFTPATLYLASTADLTMPSESRRANIVCAQRTSPEHPGKPRSAVFLVKNL